MKLLSILLALNSVMLDTNNSGKTTDADNQTIKVISLAERKAELSEYINKGGQLYCGDCEGMVYAPFDSCQSFEQLKSQNYYGYKNDEIFHEVNYGKACWEFAALDKMTVRGVSYFDLSSADWWKDLPADFMPMPSGIYNDESWDAARAVHTALTENKRMHQIDFIDIRPSWNGQKFVLKRDQEDCGVIEDIMTIDAVLLADADHDGIDDLFIMGDRQDSSDKCFLGRFSSLSAGFHRYIGKPTPDATPELVVFEK